MNYRDTLRKVYELAPKGIHLGLDRVREVACRLDLLDAAYKSVQIAGTNGKGTTAAVLSNSLVESGAKVGLFTSPHLHRFSERIQINGREGDTEQLGRHLELALAAAAHPPCVELSFFEVTTLAALGVFKENRVEYAVIEVGLGGRLDSTSICDPTLCAITSIGLDHTGILGETIPEIAKEKAGISRPEIPLIVGDISPAALSTISATANDTRSPLYVYGRDFILPAQLMPPFPGRHQAQNTAIAHELFSRLGLTDTRLTEETFKRSLGTVHWPARFELIPGSPNYLVDGAHNLDAINHLREAIEDRHQAVNTLVFGALRDKRAGEMLAILRPIAENIVLMPPPVKRAMPPEQIAQGSDVICQDANDSLVASKRVTPDGGTVLVTGSFFTVAAIRALLLGESCDPPVCL